MKARIFKGTKEHWSLGDIVNFEYFLIHTSSKENPAESAEQARHWFQLHVSDHSETGHSDRPNPEVLKAWLNHQKAQHGESMPLPGESWQWLIGMLHWFFLFVGILAGIGVTSSLLRYDGVQPVNVAMFMGVMVGVQVVWSLLSFLLIAGKGLHWIPLQAGFSLRVFHFMLHWASVRLHRLTISKIATEKRIVWESFWRHLQKDHAAAGKFLIWPILSKIQMMGVAFNLGAIAVFIVSVMFRDLAFGWQTSMQQVSDGSVSIFAKSFSIPWSWIWGEGQGFPSFAQIQGSRIILNQGIGSLQNPNLTSWWPFLLLALFVYGFLPRTMLWVWAVVKGRKQLTRYPFESASCQKLWKRFQTPFLNVSRRQFDNHSQATDGALASSVTRDPSTVNPLHATLSEHDVRCWVFMDEDLAHAINPAQVVSKLLPYGWQVEGMLNAEFLNDSSFTTRFNPGDCLLWVEEAWQPPIQEKMKKIQTCRETLSAGVLLCIGLIGKPDGDEWLTQVRPRDLEIWKKFVYQDRPEGVQVRSILNS